MKAISIDNISKQYRLGNIGTGSLVHDVNRWWHRVKGKQDPYLKVGMENDRTVSGGDYVWALKDINFDIEQGDVYGFIGRNGAGKSTLLKIISKITSPTSGEIKIKGRIASLLEVGTGFHPELTGRENIFLNGAILGMNKKEINAKLDEIIAFSGVAKYIDTPIKRYSSGMLVRLGFAVAAHLESDILIVDEVLAVGDAEFQEKCIGKMKDVSGSGRTILFVSHNMASVKALCKKGVLFDKGQVKINGNIGDAIEGYLSLSSKINQDGIIPASASSSGSGTARYRKILMRNTKNEVASAVGYLNDIKLQFEVESFEQVNDIIADIRIYSVEGAELVHAMNKYNGQSLSLQKGMNALECTLQNRLQPGKYTMTVGIHHGNGLTIDYVENVLDFKVLAVSETDGPGYTYNWKAGYVRFESDWKVMS